MSQKNLRLKLKKLFGKKIKFNYPLKNITTIKIGGPARYFLVIKKENDLILALNFIKKYKIKWYVCGGGSNIVASDKGFNGLVIQNKINYFKKNKNYVEVGAGNSLLNFILNLNKLGLAGIEKMAGIPGGVGGAIYGQAGAYGQEIGDCLIRVKVLNVQKLKFSWLTKRQCFLGYRESIFKKNKNLIIVGAEFKFKKSNPKELIKTSKEIIKLRSKKYPKNLLTAGSFFKNIIIKNIKPLKLKKYLLSKIDKTKIVFGKLSSGYLLEKIGACGMQIGQVKVANYHGNLIYNLGKGKFSDVKKLASILKRKVRQKFGINLEEEVQYII